jgi:hypothetical protein
MVQPPASPRHEPTLEAERILMVDITSTPARAKEMAPPTSREGGGQEEATATKPLSRSPPLTTDRVDKMYCQLAEIYAIAAVQLVEST